jgi:hypothetical protein
VSIKWRVAQTLEMNSEPEGSPGIEQPMAVESGVPAAPAPPSEPPAPFYQPPDWLSFGLTAGASLIIYLITLAPEVTLRFSGVLAAGANYAGVPDVPGFPVWTIYAWLFARLLPFSNIAWRVSVSSAVAGALACGLVSLMVSRGGALVLDATDRIKRLENPQHEHWLRLICGVAAGMGFALDRGVWSQAVIVETWTLALVLLAGMLCLLLRWSYQPQRMRYLYGAVLLYGLNLSNHEGMIEAALGLMLLVVLIDRPLGRDLFASLTLVLITVVTLQEVAMRPGNFRALFALYPFWQVCALCGLLTLIITIVLIVKTRRLFTRWVAILACWCLLILGLAPCLCLPIASMTNPPVNWAYPRTFEGFVHLVSRGQYPGLSPVTDLVRYEQQILWYAKTTWENLGWLYLVAALIPFFFLRRIKSGARSWLLGLVGLYFCFSFFQLAMLNPESEMAHWDWIRVFFSPAEFVLALLAGYGLVLMGTKLASVRLPSVS